MRLGDDVVTLPRVLTPLEQQSMYALVYGYPRVYFDVVCHLFSNVEQPTQYFAPVNQFGHVKLP
jgi:hypothetical protein